MKWIAQIPRPFHCRLCQQATWMTWHLDVETYKVIVRYWLTIKTKMSKIFLLRFTKKLNMYLWKDLKYKVGITKQMTDGWQSIVSCIYVCSKFKTLLLLLIQPVAELSLLSRPKFTAFANLFWELPGASSHNRLSRPRVDLSQSKK